ncbi:nuclear protein 96-domain-containing protein [Sparassis latifolia]
MRFRAYTTDSEDEEDDHLSVSSVSADELPPAPTHMDEDARSESEGSMHEDELMPPVASRKSSHALQSISEDEDMSDGEAAPSKNAPRKSMPRGPMNDPTLIPWARQLGVDAQKMHVMQTSLFRVPEEEAAMRQQAQTLARRKHLLSATLQRKHSRDSEGEGLRADSRQRASFAHDVEPTPFRPTRKYSRVDGSSSAVSGSEGLVADAGLAFGRSFRVGWGPGGTLVHLGQLCGPNSTPKGTANTSVVQKTVVPLFSVPATEASELASRLLSHHLEYTAIQADADGVPFANPRRTMSFASLMTRFPSTERSFEACLFRLGHALFDPISLRLADSITADVRPRISTIRRKAALSQWLQEAISSSIDADLRDNPGADWAHVVFMLLTGNQVDRACEVAMEGGNVKLASLIAQYPGDEEFRDDLLSQLALWRDERVDAHISENVRKVYALLAGIVDTLEGSKGTGVEQCPDINLAEGLSWKRAFGLHLWFGQPLEASVADAFQSYDASWKEPTSVVSAPVPWYAEEAQQESRSSPWKLPSSANPPDALFSLIRLFADPVCSLSTILTPFSFSASPIDYRLAWHLYIVMSRCLRVRDFADRGLPGGDVLTEMVGDDDEPIEGHSPSADLLANSYALQLEQMGMIQEAVFVLLHIEGSAGRARAVKALLGRCARKLDDWTTRGLVGSLKLPMAWVHEAKAVYALDNNDVFGAYELYIGAGLYNAAHELAVLALAPDAVIHQDFALLNEIFKKFIGHPVDGWHAFMDYAHAMTRLPVLRARLADAGAAADAADASELEQLAHSVPKLIGILPDVLRDRSDTRHKAALAEMTAELTRRLDEVKPLAIHQSQIRSPFMSEGIRQRNIQMAALERFVRSIEVA